MNIDITDIVEYDLYQTEIKKIRQKIFIQIYYSLTRLPYYICKYIVAFVI